MSYECVNLLCSEGILVLQPQSLQNCQRAIVSPLPPFQESLSEQWKSCRDREA